MALVTSQQLVTYYERYRSIEVTFTKEIIQVTGLLTQQVHLKCVSDFWPCVIYSASFEGAKVVANTQSGLLNKLQQANNTVSLRFCFKNTETNNPVTFFVASRVSGYTPYGGAKDVALFSLSFTQRPPDDLIGIVGRILDANVNSAKRRDERIILAPDSMRKLNLLTKETAVFIQGVPRRCILRDISFSGAKIIMMGVAKFLIDRDMGIRLDFEDPRESFLLRGKFIRSEEIEGKKEMIALAAQFTDGLVPMGFKIRVNDYISKQKTDKPESQTPEAAPAAEKPASEGKLPDEKAEKSAEKKPAPQKPAAEETAGD